MARANIDAYRVLVAQQGRAHVRRGRLLILHVGDEASGKMRACFRRVCQVQSEQPRGSRFRNDEFAALVFEKAKKFLGQLFNLLHGGSPQAVRLRGRQGAKYTHAVSGTPNPEGVGAARRGAPAETNEVG
jgi:hypothetical protein